MAALQLCPRVDECLLEGAAVEGAGQRVAVVGGGISKKADKFLPKLKLKSQIVAATLQNTAGIVGAAWMAVDRRDNPVPVPTGG